MFITFTLFLGLTAAADIVNVINPQWEAKIASNLAASVIGVDATATTYVINCLPNQTVSETLTALATPTIVSEPCEIFARSGQTLTQGPTMENFASTLIQTIIGENLSATNMYSYSSILAPTITANEVTIDETIPTSFPSFSLTRTGTTETFTNAIKTFNATWLPITITAGQELLASSAAASITSVPTTSSGSAANNDGDTSAASSAIASSTDGTLIAAAVSSAINSAATATGSASVSVSLGEWLLGISSLAVLLAAWF